MIKEALLPLGFSSAFIIVIALSIEKRSSFPPKGIPYFLYLRNTEAGSILCCKSAHCLKDRGEEGFLNTLRSHVQNEIYKPIREMDTKNA